MPTRGSPWILGGRTLPEHLAVRWDVVSTVVRDGRIPEWTGPITAAGLLRAMQAIDSSLATRLHDAAGPKPYAVTPLSGEAISSGEPGRLCLVAGEQVGFQLFVWGEAARACEKVIPSLRGTKLSLSSAIATVESLERTDIATADLVEPLLQGDRLRVRFETPTAFKHKRGHLQVFPLPSLVVQSTLQKWSADLGIAEPLPDPEAIVVTSYNLKTVPLSLPDSNYIGFIGKVEYKFDSASPEHKMVFGLASISGCGVKTAQGMGRIALVPRTSSDKKQS